MLANLAAVLIALIAVSTRTCAQPPLFVYRNSGFFSALVCLPPSTALEMNKVSLRIVGCESSTASGARCRAQMGLRCLVHVTCAVAVVLQRWQGSFCRPGACVRARCLPTTTPLSLACHCARWLGRRLGSSEAVRILVLLLFFLLLVSSPCVIGEQCFVGEDS